MAKLQQESRYLSFETLSVAVKAFTPSKCETSVWDDANLLHLYCAARLWATSGLFQQENIDKQASPSDSKSMIAEVKGAVDGKVLPEGWLLGASCLYSDAR